jgi:hypothetical protein
MDCSSIIRLNTLTIYLVTEISLKAEFECLRPASQSHSYTKIRKQGRVVHVPGDKHVKNIQIKTTWYVRYAPLSCSDVTVNSPS